MHKAENVPIEYGGLSRPSDLQNGPFYVLALTFLKFRETKLYISAKKEFLDPPSILDAFIIYVYLIKILNHYRLWQAVL